MEFSLDVKTRQPDKDSQLTEIRGQAQVPGVVYGLDQKPQPIVIDYNPLLKILTQAGTSNIISLKLADKKIKVIVREFQQDPVTDKVIHVDFLAVNDKTTITTTIPLEFVGVSKAVKEKGAKLSVKNDQIHVKCLPQDLPTKIDVNVAGLDEIGQTILIKDLQVAENVIVLDNGNDPVLSVIIPRKIEVVEEVVETPAEGEEGEVPAEGEEGETPAEGQPAKEGEIKDAKLGEEKPASPDKSKQAEK